MKISGGYMCYLFLGGENMEGYGIESIPYELPSGYLT